MNKLRRELNELLADTYSIRPATLRRSLREDFLYATDLPQTADSEAVFSFICKAEAAGWRTADADGWIQLDKCPAEPPEPPALPGPEARCCAALLRQHPEGRRNSSREKRILIKAAEKGSGARERACAALHREWAENLRKHEGLPDLSEKWFEEESKC